MISDADELIVAEGMTQAVGRTMVSSWSTARRRNWGGWEEVEEDKWVKETKGRAADRGESRENGTEHKGKG